MRSHHAALLRSHPPTPVVKAVMPTIAVKLVKRASAIFPCRSNPTPAGASVNIKGTTNAGSVYFHAMSIVLYGFPPVSADAANGASPTGGENSERIA